VSRHHCCQCDEELDLDDLGTCEACGEKVCFECAKHSSGPHECIDYTICLVCHEGREDARRFASHREWKQKKARSEEAKARYNSPEARAKRAAKKAEADRVRAEQEVERRKRMAAELAEVMSGFARFF
jgi:hypothetical protein